MKSENERVLDMGRKLFEILKDDVPSIGASAMAHLLASHTEENREIWVEEMGNIWDCYHGDKSE